MSKLFSLNQGDLLRGIVVAVLSGVLTLLLELLKNKGLVLNLEDLSTIINVAISSGLGYILKNLLTDEEGKLGGKYKI